MPMPKKEEKLNFDATKDLTEQQQKDFVFVQDRIKALQEVRKDVYGVNLESIWADADKEYVPHELRGKGKKIVAIDEEKGWRGTLVELGSEDAWQSDVSQENAYIKIQTALGILVDRNPEGIFTPGGSKYEGSTPLVKQLYQRNWEIAKSKQQLKLFIFNLAKYGWACGRTYPLKIARKVKELVEYNEEEPSKSIYKEVEAVEYNDIFRENFDPWNVWIDDLAKPSNPFSIRDWAFRKVYSWSSAEELFSKYPNWKFVQKRGKVAEKVSSSGVSKEYQEKELVEVYFYENKEKDLLMGIFNDIPVVIEPLPVSDSQGNKKLSLWQTYWTLRHAESPYGVGLYEAIRNNQKLLDRIRNMTLDQLTLSIYKMGFYQGTDKLTETGKIKISPGVLKQTLDPKNINWLEIKGPGQEAWEGIKMLKEDLNEASGITEPLMGTIVGKTAFEIAQAKEAALKRIKTPLDNICDALEEDGYITVYLIQLLYSIPEVIRIADPNKIEAYLNEIKSDQDLYEEDTPNLEQGEERAINAKIYREFPLNLEADDKGNLRETAETRFFRAKPKYLKWEGIIKIKPQSILTPSKQLDKALDLEMVNILIPLLAQPPEIFLKIAKQILKIYEKEPEDWLPDLWLNPQPLMQAGQEQPLFVPSNAMERPMTDEIGGGAEKLTTNPTLPSNPQSLGGKIINKLTGLFGR